MNQKFMEYKRPMLHNGAKLFVVGIGASLVSENHIYFEIAYM